MIFFWKNDWKFVNLSLSLRFASDSISPAYYFNLSHLCKWRESTGKLQLKWQKGPLLLSISILWLFSASKKYKSSEKLNQYTRWNWEWKETLRKKEKRILGQKIYPISWINLVKRNFSKRRKIRSQIMTKRKYRLLTLKTKNKLIKSFNHFLF